MIVEHVDVKRPERQPDVDVVTALMAVEAGRGDANDGA